MTSSVEPALPAEDLMRHSGAEWCEEHLRWECIATSRRSGNRCHGAAISGLSRCRMHCGRPGPVAKALGEANLAAWSTAAASGEQPLPNPGLVVLEQLRLSVMRAELYGEMLRWQLDAEELGGLVGVTHAAGREGQRVETGERVRGLVQLESAERDRAVRFAKTAHDMGIAERQVQLEQEKAQIVTAAFRQALTVVVLLPADRDLMLRTFLTGLGHGPGELEGAAS